MVRTPAGPLQLKSFGRDECAWLAGTTGKSPDLRIGRKVLKVMKEIEKIDEELQALGMQPKTGSAIASVLSHPEVRAQRRVPEAQLALVPYVPSQPPTGAAPQQFGAEPSATTAPPEADGAGPVPPPGQLFAWASRELAPAVWEIFGPYVWTAKMFFRAITYVPWVVHVILMLYLLLGVVAVFRAPERLVEWAFALLDLVPGYFAFAGERVANQVGIEIAKRFR